MGLVCQCVKEWVPVIKETERERERPRGLSPARPRERESRLGWCALELGRVTGPQWHVKAGLAAKVAGQQAEMEEREGERVWFSFSFSFLFNSKSFSNLFESI
jgi:hypothetical protein